MNLQTVCFTGHRPDKLDRAYDPAHPTAQRIRGWIEKALADLYQQGVRHFISGMALGVDQWAAEAVIHLKQKHPDVRLIAAVPMTSQADVWPERSRRHWLWLLQAADEIYVAGERVEDLQ